MVLMLWMRNVWIGIALVAAAFILLSVWRMKKQKA